MKPSIEAFHDPVTGTLSYVVHAGRGSPCAVIDPVLDYDARSGRTSTQCADRIVAFVREQQLQVMQKQGIELQTDLEKNGATMAASEREAKEKRLGVMAQQYQQAQRSLLEDVEVRKRESLADFLADVNVIIKGLAEAGKYDLIIQQSVYNSAQVDITEQVLAEIAKRSGGARK